TIGAVGREGQHAVVPPVPVPGEIRDRHEFDRGEAGLGEVIELLERRPERAGRREGPDVELEHDGFRPGPSAPLRRAPSVVRIDDLAWPVHVLRLKARGGIGHHEIAVGTRSIAPARPRVRDDGLEPTLRLRAHRTEIIEHEIDTLCSGSPQPERNATLRVEPHTEARGGHSAPSNTSTERGGASQCAPTRYSAPADFFVPTVESRKVQREHRGQAGRTKSIGCSAVLSTMNSGAPRPSRWPIP